MIQQPASICINWAACDELSDNVELTEALAMRQLDEWTPSGTPATAAIEPGAHR